jgi:type II secretory pathway pseudopilin PulG
MVVALAMVAIIAAALASTLWNAYHATRSAEAAVTPSDQAAQALDIFAADLQCALQQAPGSGNASVTSLIGTPLTQNNDEQTAFLGTQGQDNRGHEADDVVFFTTNDSPVHVYANGEVKCVEYRVVQPLRSKDYVLVRRVTRNLLAREGQIAATDEEVICTGISSFALEYSYDGVNFSPAPLTPGDWDASQEDNTIPAAVKVTLALDSPLASGKTGTTSHTRIISLPCSTAELDPQVNTGISG